jgi:hypothetical protein
MQSVNAASKPVFFRLGADHNVLRGDEHLYKQLSLRQFKSHMRLYQLMRTLRLEDIASSSVLLPPHLCSAASHSIRMQLWHQHLCKRWSL